MQQRRNLKEFFEARRDRASASSESETIQSGVHTAVDQKCGRVTEGATFPWVIAFWICSCFVAVSGGKDDLMARPERFELPTYCSGGNRSIQLSYGRDAAGLY
jgi:hypothetical protein